MTLNGRNGGGSPGSVLLLTAGSSIHSQRWASGLAQRGLRVTVVSQHEFLPGNWGTQDLVKLPWRGELGYFANARRVRSVTKDRCPDVVNVHFASGYGLCALLSGVRPYVLSVWGADVYDFPGKSPIHRAVVRNALARARRVASTSHVMARQVEKILKRSVDISITPFGVDTNRFRPVEKPRNREKVVVGTVKTLAHKYGIDVLLRAFARLRDDPDLSPERQGLSVEFRIAGGGPEASELRALANRLGLDADAIFMGAIPHDRVPEVLNSFDVYVAASRLDSESFGVAIIEASACGVPVVVSDVGGLPEVVRDGVTGLIVPRENDEALYRAIKALIMDEGLRFRMGRAGTEFVAREYEWERCIDAMLECYRAARE